MAERYRVQWEIDLEADSPEEAAREALRIQRNPESIATVYEIFTDEGVHITRVDITEG